MQVSSSATGCASPAISSSRFTCRTGSRATVPGGAWTTRRIDPEHLAGVIAAEIDRPVDYSPVETDGAARAAALLAELL